MLYVTDQGKWQEADQVAVSQMRGMSATLPKKSVKAVQKITVAAVTSSRIVGYGKKNLTYKIRSPRHRDVNEAEEVILRLVKGSQETSPGTWNFNLKKPQELVAVAAIVVVLILVLVVFPTLYVYCRRKRTFLNASTERFTQETETVV